MGSAPKRSLVKGISWEIISFSLTLLIIYIINRNIIISLGLSAILTAVKIPFYFIHERVWKKIKWGKIENEKRKKKHPRI